MNATDHRYTLIDRIAVGGMGEVWRATDATLQREVAVKLLRSEYADDPEFRARFHTEARNAASLLHPGIAAVFDYGERPDQSGQLRPYLVMEYVDGRPLSELLRGGRPLAPEVATDLICQAADALALAHQQGVVHRDVKPANLLVTPDGSVKVTDFGIARATDAVPLTRTGQVLGTPQYLSPEQAQGEAATPASDVYSLGVVLHECLTGSRPFTGDTPVAIALAHVREPVPELPDDVPAHLAAITRRAMAKDPAERYPDAGAFAAALRKADGAAPATRVLAAPPAVGRRRLPTWWPLAAVGLAAAVLLAGLFAARGSGGPATGPAKPPSSNSSSPVVQQAVRLQAADYVGRDARQVARELRALGLRTRPATAPNDGSHAPGTVARLAPTGQVRLHALVTVTAWGDRPPEPQQQAQHQPGPTKKHGPPKGHDNGKAKGHHKGGKGGHHG